MLEATFTSVQEMIEHSAWSFLPVSLILTQRFDTLGPKEPRTASRGGRNTVGSATPQGNGCGEASSGLTELPMQQIETNVRPTDEQLDEFRRFKDATAKAVQYLQSHCPQEAAGTPGSR